MHIRKSTATRGPRRWTQTLTVTASALALTAGPVGLGAAAAADQTPSASPPAAASDVQPHTASGCTTRNGPGDFNQNCIDVIGQGIFVDSIRGFMASSTDSAPVQFCNVTVNVFGTLTGGVPYNETGTAECGTGAAWVDFYPRAEFVPNSMVCSRTLFADEWSNPACIEVYY